MRRLLVIALTTVIWAACSELDDPQNKIIEKAAQKALQERLGHGVKAKMTADGIIISGQGAEYTISFSVKNHPTAKEPPGDLPLFPGASITGYFKGADEDTVRLIATGSAGEIAGFYQEVFKKKGFIQKRAMTGESEFSGAWISPRSGFGVNIYSYKEKERSQIVMIISWAEEAEEAAR
ncbi:hypothetical protein MNBD_NITROSPINAE03-1776 [hydrothermal vent metagenome]|uniref:Lipoprotein n=1 Tax=hydrothermal vent metagenome TaxID=652676 RepID=A0A3B1CAE4_9ZZZZ